MNWLKFTVQNTEEKRDAQKRSYKICLGERMSLAEYRFSPVKGAMP